MPESGQIILRGGLIFARTWMLETICSGSSRESLLGPSLVSQEQRQAGRHVASRALIGLGILSAGFFIRRPTRSSLPVSLIVRRQEAFSRMMQLPLIGTA